LEVLLSNNGADPSVKVAAGPLLNDPRVRHLEQPQVLDMPTHFEVVSKLARGRYLILHTHRSVLKREALAEVAAAHAKYGNDGAVVSWRWDLFYEDKGLLAPARDGLNRVYSYKDRARLQLILQGKRVGLSLAEIGEILDLYEVGDGGAQQAAKSLKKFRERIVALERQKIDIDEQIAQLRQGCEAMEKRLEATRPDLLPRAVDYDQTMRRQLDGAEH